MDRQLPTKELVRGSIPLRGSMYAWLAQLVEQYVANVQVAGSNPVPRTKQWWM